MTSVAYITALIIGVFAVWSTKASALTYQPQAQPQHKAELTAEPFIDPLDKYRNAKKLGKKDLIQLLRAVGFEGSSLRTAWAVAMKESGGRPIAHNDNHHTGDNSYGLFQINMMGDLGYLRREKFSLGSNKELFDPVTNAQVAYYMTAKGTNWGSWGYGPDAYDGDAAEPKITFWKSQFPN